MDYIYENIDEYNPIRKWKILIIVDMIADMLGKKLYPIAPELFIRVRKLNISLIFITQFYFVLSKNIRLISTNYFVMKIPYKRELQQMPIQVWMGKVCDCTCTLPHTPF